jgi:ribose transport system substrate-binding protein
MKPEKRHQEIIELLLEQGSITLRELRDRFQCSGGTIRNDLRALEAQGKLIRTFAGATIEGAPNRRTAQQGYSNSEDVRLDVIAQRAAELVREGDTILLCDGSLTARMVDHLLTLKTLTIVTNDLDTARRFSRNPNYVVILIGGQVSFESNTLHGASGIPMLQNLRVNKAFVQCEGVTGAQGFAAEDASSAQLKSAMVACADQLIILATSAAIGRPSQAGFAALNQATHMITSSDAGVDGLATVRASGVRVSLCSERFTELRAEARPDRIWRIGFANLIEHDDFAMTIRQSIELAAQARGNIELVLANNDGDPQMALANARRFVDAQVDLVIDYQLYERINHAIMDLLRRARIPVIAVDIPMPGAVFFGADNYRAGRIAGEAAAAWIWKHWGGRLDRIVCLDQSILGPLPAARIDGQIDALRGVLRIEDDSVLHVDTGDGQLEDSRAAATAALRNIPWGNRVLFAGISANHALGAMRAAETLGRADRCCAVAQNVTAHIRRELDAGTPMLIGAVDYSPEQYGYSLIQLAIDMLEGRAVPPATYTEHRLVTADDRAAARPTSRVEPRTSRSSVPL